MLLVDSPAPHLVGIARLAASGSLLEAKRRVDYRELPTRRFITRCRSDRVPFDWTINPYRGCEFGCKYCYARYTHEFMELRDPWDFETKIFAKRWNVDSFREELRKIDPRQWIAIGTATDPYQPAERRY
ncbi:MAG: radical SAM protein, partial [bacterium]|nr:radical SAM protein [bacterium]